MLKYNVFKSSQCDRTTQVPKSIPVVQCGWRFAFSERQSTRNSAKQPQRNNKKHL